MGCDRNSDVERYHDGELKLDQRARLESHFQACPECRQALRELGRLSVMLTRAAGVEPRSGFVSELERRSRRAARDTKTMRLAGWLTATAAAVLIGAVLLRPERPRPVMPSPEIWEAVAVRPTPAEASSDSMVMVAQWVVDDLSSTEQR